MLFWNVKPHSMVHWYRPSGRAYCSHLHCSLYTSASYRKWLWLGWFDKLKVVSTRLYISYVPWTVRWTFLLVLIMSRWWWWLLTHSRQSIETINALILKLAVFFHWSVMPVLQSCPIRGTSSGGTIPPPTNPPSGKLCSLCLLDIQGCW